MGKLIKDDFTDLKVSRQRKAQLRHRRDGFCEKCWRPALEKKDGRFAVYCEFHARKQVIKRAKKKGLIVRRNSSKWGKRGERFENG